MHPALVLGLIAASLLSAQDALGPPRWMPIPATRVAPLDKILDRVKALPLLTPPPGVYPNATFTANPPGGSLMLGFWPPNMTALRNGQLRPAGELSHVLIYVNQVRIDALDRTYWEDAEGQLMPQPRQVGDLQGFPIYEGFGSVELSGIVVVQPAGRSLFTPVTRARFHAYEIANLEAQLKRGAPVLKTAQDLYAARTSPAGRAAEEARMLTSLADYQKGRTRTPEQVKSRDADIRRLSAEESERLRVDSEPATNRIIGPLTTRLNRAKASLAALSPAERTQPACHADGGTNDPHPVPPDTASCRPVVSVAPWFNPALPRTTPQLLTIERYWPSSEEVRRLGQRASPWHHLNKQVIEALDWHEIAAALLK